MPRRLHGINKLKSICSCFLGSAGNKLFAELTGRLCESNWEEKPSALECGYTARPPDEQETEEKGSPKVPQVLHVGSPERRLWGGS